MQTLAIIPNVLSVVRLGLAGWFPFAPAEYRLGIVLAAGFTDFADGFVARRYKVTSWTGGLLDAVADKLFVLSVLVTLAVGHRLAWWQILPLLSRDFAVGFIAAYAAAVGKWYAFRHMPARPLGKVTTAVMFLFFVLAVALLHDRWGWFMTAFAVTAALSAIAAIDYLLVFIRARRKDRDSDAASSEP